MKLNLMDEQLKQVFEYAELIVRLDNAQEMLDVAGGYFGESQLYQDIEDVKNTVRKNMEKHLQNSQVSKRAMTIINNYIVLNKTI